jgi:glucose/arabinose dehydrogenase
VRSRWAALAAAVLVAGGCGENETAGPNASPSNPPPSAATCSSAAPVANAVPLVATRVLTGLNRPVDLQSPPGDCRLFILEQQGRIRVVRNGALVAVPFLDIISRILSGGERGLLGLAFHPRYAENGRFFVNYTNRDGDTHVSEFRASPPSGDSADPGSEKRLLFVAQPFANHNGGGLAFGPDGFLYIGLGDGGSGGDPQGNGQRLDTLLGKMLRLDVDAASPYAVPGDNPFVSRSGARPEIWAYGLRNPWRFSFDKATGEMLIADVGQNAVEEISLASRRGGENFGWNTTEGTSCFRPSSGCPTAGLTLPISEYRHPAGQSITGGYVYRGRRMPFLQGTYFYADYVRPGFIRSFRLQNGTAADARDRSGELGAGLTSVTSFGLDADGELYVVDHDGEIYRIDPAQ